MTNVIFFGSSKYVIPIIETLNENFELSLVITTERLTEDPIPAYCSLHNIKYRSISSFDETLNSDLLALHIPLGIVADFGLIIPSYILDLFPKGLINVHPSLLPKYRGATPVQEAILNAEKETGVSIIKLDEKLDHGPLLIQKKEFINPTDTAETLYTRIFQKGAQILPGVINKYLSGNLQPVAQNDQKATFTKRLFREDGFISLDNPISKEILERMIRAYYPWPGVWTKLKIEKGELRIKLLPENKIQVEGKKPVNYKDFINGYPQIDKKILHLLHLLNNK